MKLFDIPVPQVNLGDVFTLGKHRLMCGDVTAMDQINIKLGKSCLTMEIMPYYCGKIIERWQNTTGKQAVKIGGDHG